MGKEREREGGGGARVTVTRRLADRERERPANAETPWHESDSSHEHKTTSMCRHYIAHPLTQCAAAHNDHVPKPCEYRQRGRHSSSEHVVVQKQLTVHTKGSKQGWRQVE